jgi:hypothetical protein
MQPSTSCSTTSAVNHPSVVFLYSSPLARRLKHHKNPYLSIEVKGRGTYRKKVELGKRGCGGGKNHDAKKEGEIRKSS